MQPASETKKAKGIFPPPVNPSDKTTHVDAISGRIHCFQGNACEYTCSKGVLRCQLREKAGGFGTGFEPAVISERLSGRLRFIPVLLKDGRTSN